MTHTALVADPLHVALEELRLRVLAYTHVTHRTVFAEGERMQ